VKPVVVVVVVAGVTGSGKTTVGTLLANRLGWSFTDGDTLHPAANIAKLAAGQPLSDDDRRPWLRAIAAWMDQRIGAGERAVIACSALKRDYRDQLLDGRPAAVMAFLEIGVDTAASRLAARHGHFADPMILDSQFADLEPPSQDESSVVVVRADHAPDQLVGQIIGRLNLAG
jgi:gluconokinase